MFRNFASTGNKDSYFNSLVGLLVLEVTEGTHKLFILFFYRMFVDGQTNDATPRSTLAAIQTAFIYKLSVLTYKALHTGQPCYLADLIDSYEPYRCLRSTNCHLLAVPSCVKSSFASRAFCVSSPNNWNSLPAHIRSSDSLVTFQSRLKSHLFSSAYHV